ncbi:hypothetical protein AGMMS49579_22590 [Spirochaetia bacterium]|nr:hypothetical protein AGMMS49579_22590 [Spirochaetia bacterium]
MRKHCFFWALFFLSIFFLAAQEKIVIEHDYTDRDEKGHYITEIIFDNDGIIKSRTGNYSVINVAKEQNTYIVTDTTTNSETEVWRVRERKHFIEENNGVITVWWNTTMQPMTVAITENTIKLETGERLDFSMNSNTITLGRYVLSYENGRLIRIDDPGEFQLFNVTRQNSRQYVINIINPGSGSDKCQIWTDTTPKTMRQNAINFLILLFNKPVSYIPFIIGRY